MGFLYYAVIMGNVSGKKEEETGEGSGIKNQEHEEEESMEYGLFPDSMVQSPPHTPKAYHYSPLVFTPQVRGSKRQSTIQHIFMSVRLALSRYSFSAYELVFEVKVRLRCHVFV